MLDFIDRKLEKLFITSLHKKRNKMIDEVFSRYKKTHQINDDESASLRDKMELEADRVIAMSDRSIIRASIQRAKYTFFGASMAGFHVVVIVGLATGFTALPFITPVASGGAAWLVAVALIPTSYLQRLKGGMDSIVVLFEDERREKEAVEKSKSENKMHQETTNELLQAFPLLIKRDHPVSLEQVSTEILNDKNNIKGIFLWKQPPIENQFKAELVPDKKSDDVFVTFVMNGSGKK